MIIKIEAQLWVRGEGIPEGRGGEEILVVYVNYTLLLFGHCFRSPYNTWFTLDLCWKLSTYLCYLLYIHFKQVQVLDCPCSHHLACCSFIMAGSQDNPSNFNLVMISIAVCGQTGCYFLHATKYNVALQCSNIN